MKAALRLSGFVLAGLAQAASIATPWNGQPLWWLQLLAIATLIWQFDRLRESGSSWRTAFFYGWAFATSWLTGTFWWLFISMHVYGGMVAPVAALAVFALAAALALYYAAACALYVAAPNAGSVENAAIFASVWTLAELLRGSWFTGFPWGAGGYAHLGGPLVGFAAWAGVYGLGAVAALIAGLLAGAMAPRRRAEPVGIGLEDSAAKPATPPTVALIPTPAAAAKPTPIPTQWRRSIPLAIAILLLLLPIVMRAPTTQSTGKIRVALLQGNIPQDEKFVPGGGIATALGWYEEQLRSATAPLVITPETAIPLLPAQLPPGYLAAIASRYQSGTQAAIVGLPIGDNRSGYTNSVLGFRAGSAPTYRYDKHHLVPFGEFIPSGFRWFIDLMSIPLGDFARGGLAQPRFDWQGQRIAPNICYEDLFGDEIGAGFRDVATAPTILLNVSNIAWFGDTVAIDQHLAISRMRAIEFARPMVRATNTGATVVIDHLGQVTHSLPRLTRGVLEADVEGRSGLTPYAWWVSRYGLAPLWIACFAIVIALWFSRRRR